MAPQYYNAWLAVMNGPRPQKLLCTWHVDRAWREELKKKIGKMELEAEIYKMLRTVLEERDEIKFQETLHLFLNYFKVTPTMKQFSTYFEQYWPGRKEEWAFVFRKGTGINTNMYVESFHRVFPYKLFIFLRCLPKPYIHCKISKFQTFIILTEFTQITSNFAHMIISTCCFMS